MIRRRHYLVFGDGLMSCYNDHGWFNACPWPWRSSSGFVRAFSLRQALAQCKRVPVKDRAIDVRNDPKRRAPYVLL